MAVMNLVLGSLLLLCYLFNSVTTLLQSSGARNNPGFGGPGNDMAVKLEREMEASVPGYRGIQVAQSLVGLALSILLLLSGIGMLNLKNWGRIGSIIWALLMILYEVGITGYHLAVLSPAMTRALRDVPMGPGGPPATMIVTITSVVIVFFALLFITYAIVLLLMMLRANVVAAFSGLPPEEPGREWKPGEPPTGEQPAPGSEPPPPSGGGEQGIRRNPWDY
jgi:hypothetical protein